MVPRSWKCFGEEIRKVGVGVNILREDLLGTHSIAAKELLNTDVFGTRVEILTLQKSEGSLIIHV